MLPTGLTLFLVGLALGPPSQALSESRPKVCLVLAGGGALGLAHIGVLEVLEEARVPIDCIVGTSMGAVVGGLYAAGTSATELAAIARHLDWAGILRDSPDRRRLSFRRKVDDLNYLTRWELGVSRRGVVVPASLVAGHRLGNELRLLALRAQGVTDFDRLPIPFRATATDLANGALVVLGKGDLAAALRASMAVPGLFSPLELDGRILVDGGVVANLPVAQARALGAAIVIAVDLAQPLASRERPESMLGVLGRTVDFISRLGVERALPDVDLLIRPQVGDFTLLDFSDPATLIERGRAAAQERRAQLVALALGEGEWPAELARRRRPKPELRLRSVAVEPGPGLPRRVVEGAVRTEPGSIIEHERLRADLDRLWELGAFAAVDFSLAPHPLGDWALSIRGREKPVGPNLLRFGLALSSDLEGASTFNSLAALTMTGLNRIGGEVKVTAQVGEAPLLLAEWYQPLSASQLPFLALGVQGSQAKFQLAVDGTSVQYRLWESRVALDLGLSLHRYGELRLGLRRDDSTSRPTSDHPRRAGRSESTDAGVRASLVIDQLDRLNFPRRGLLAVTEIYESHRSLGADSEYRRLDQSLLVAGTRGRQTLVGWVRFGSGLGGALPAAERLRLGGLFNLSGLPAGEVSGSKGGVAALVYLIRLGRLPRFGDGLYAGLSLETGQLWEHEERTELGDLRRSAALVLGADTFLGPTYLAYGRTTGGKDSLYLYLGRTF